MTDEEMKTKELVELGARIKELRLKAQLTQDDLGFELGFGGGSTVSNYENGTREITHTGLNALSRIFAEYLGDHKSYLIMGHEQDSPESVRASDSNYFRKDEAVTQLAKLIPVLVAGRDLRLGKNLKASQLIHLVCKKAFGASDSLQLELDKSGTQ